MRASDLQPLFQGCAIQSGVINGSWNIFLPPTLLLLKAMATKFEAAIRPG
jgi:hypothetical protein